MQQGQLLERPIFPEQVVILGVQGDEDLLCFDLLLLLSSYRHIADILAAVHLPLRV